MAEIVSVLPKIVFRDILCSWLSLGEVGRVDAALCVHASRDVFKQILTMGVWRYNCNIHWGHKSFIYWVGSRNIRFSNITFTNALLENEKLREALLARFGSSLRKITFDGAKDHVEAALLDLSLACADLESCTIQHTVDVALLTLLSRNPNVTYLSIHFKHELLPKLARFAPNLVELTIHNNIAVGFYQSFLQHRPPQLQRLLLPALECIDGAVLQRTLTKFTHLRELQVGIIDHNFTRYALPSTVPNLLKFRCRFTRKVNAECVMHLSRLMPHLQSLILLVKDDNSHMLMLNNPEQSIDEELLMLVLSQWPHLRQFVMLERCEDMLLPLPLLPLPTQTALSQVHTVSLLEELYITTDHHIGLDAVLARCPHLHSVGYSAMYRDSQFPDDYIKLKSLTGGRIKRLVVTEQIWRSEAVMISGLEELVLFSCFDYTHDDLLSIARNNPNLKTLRLEKLHNTIKHTNLTAFLTMCPLLHTVVFNFYPIVDKPSGAHTEGKAMFHNMVRNLYPHLVSFETNMV